MLRGIGLFLTLRRPDSLQQPVIKQECAMKLKLEVLRVWAYRVLVAAACILTLFLLKCPGGMLFRFGADNSYLWVGVAP